MFDKVRNIMHGCAISVKNKIAIRAGAIKWLVFSYFMMVAILVMTYYAAWLWLWDSGKVALGDLLALIKEMVGASMVAFVTFIATCCVDKDGDDIPDCFEKERDEK